MGKKVFVGLSGGVDSAVSAALLKEQGYDVTGAFIKIWQPEFIECTWRTDRLDAMRVCAALDIPFKEIDLSDVYKKEVVDTMLAEYTSGRTPNPDVLCNRSVKFGTFAQWAFQNGADYVATGHYAQIEHKNGEARLLRGADVGKDQSYFLCRLTQEDLKKTIFPIGGMEKAAVRALARSLNLPVASKHDSQGLCFVGDVSMADFLRRYIVLEQGPVLNQEGERIGVHEGAVLYTIGQRHGFTVTQHDTAAVPLYVVEIRVAENAIVVSADKHAAAKREASIQDLQWVGEKPRFPVVCEAQTRYREMPVRVELVNDSSDAHVLFGEPHMYSPGQAIVFYDDVQCLGSAVLN